MELSESKKTPNSVNTFSARRISMPNEQRRSDSDERPVKWEGIQGPSSATGTDKGEYRKLLNDMQIMTFKVRTLEEKVDKVVKEAGMNESGQQSGRNVAFTSRLRNNVTASSHQTLVFDDVLTNVGRAYDPDTGTFKAPFSGRYLFSLTVRAQYQRQVCAEIVAEPLVIAQVVAGDTEIERASASVTVVVKLEAGNEVYVRETKPWTGHFFGEGYTAFTGILL